MAARGNIRRSSTASVEKPQLLNWGTQEPICFASYSPFRQYHFPQLVFVYLEMGICVKVSGVEEHKAIGKITPLNLGIFEAVGGYSRSHPHQ